LVDYFDGEMRFDHIKFWLDHKNRLQNCGPTQSNEFLAIQLRFHARCFFRNQVVHQLLAKRDWSRRSLKGRLLLPKVLSMSIAPAWYEIGWINHPFKPRRELPSSPDVFASSTSRQDCCIA
jgi:hypothetical protein